MTFNEEQLEAINTLEGNVRVIAGAGSGKTRALTHRYAKLIESGVAPEEILCVTFTNKAAEEMKERIAKITGYNNYTLICTFHSFCLRLLRQYMPLFGYAKEFNVLDSGSRKTVLQKVYKDCKLTRDIITYGTAFDIINERKVNREELINEMLKHNPIIKKKYDEARDALLKETYKSYSQTLKDVIYYGYLYYEHTGNGIDFDDFIILAVKLLKEFPDVLTKWQKRLKYVMVDEFQDVSNRQYELVKMLSATHGNLFVVGDPDQTIYTWRGAKPEILVNLNKDLKDVKTIIMNQNYRSTPEILDVANELISKNELRVKKDLFTENESGNKPYYARFEDEKSEAKEIASLIKKAVRERGYKYEDIAVLYRAHYISRAVEEKLVTNHIPYHISSDVNFYERKEIQDVLAYLKLAANTTNNAAFDRIINVPSRKIGPAKLKKIQEVAEMNNCSYYSACHILSKASNVPAIEDFLTVIDKIKSRIGSKTVCELARYSISISGYIDLLNNKLEPERKENVIELLKSMEDLPEGTTLNEYLEKIALMTNSDKKEDNNCVSLMTIHASKGLEFPIVFVIGMSEGMFPTNKAITFELMEEERRLAYVAFTRAQRHLILTSNDSYDYNTRDTRKVSRFLNEVDHNKIDGCEIPYEKYDEPYRSEDSYETNNTKCHGQYFDKSGNYYDWDDDTYCQGSVHVTDIVDACDLC